MDKAKIENTIIQLQKISNDILVRDAFTNEFNKNVLQEKRWHTKNKGWGRIKKIKSFNKFFKNKIHFENYIYVFLYGKKCKYAGRSLAGGTRPETHFEKYWFDGVTRINIYSTSQPTQVPKLECLAIHKFEPSVNRNKPSFSKGDKLCPICENERYIKQELKSMFKLR